LSVWYIEDIIISVPFLFLEPITGNIFGAS